MWCTSVLFRQCCEEEKKKSGRRKWNRSKFLKKMRKKGGREGGGEGKMEEIPMFGTGEAIETTLNPHNCIIAILYAANTPHRPLLRTTLLHSAAHPHPPNTH